MGKNQIIRQLLRSPEANRRGTPLLEQVHHPQKQAAFDEIDRNAAEKAEAKAEEFDSIGGDQEEDGAKR